MRAPLLLLLLAGLPLVATAQDPRPAQDPATGQPVRPRDIYGRQRGGPGSNLDRALQGCWKLVTVQSDSVDFSSATLNGCALVSDGFLAFEMQAYFSGPRVNRFDEYQTFFSEYRLEPSGLMTLTTLAGSWLEPDGSRLEWEAVGTQRRMQVEFPSPNMLVLTPDTGGRMTFVRRLSSNRAASSIYGQPADGSQGNPSIFGTRSNPFKETPAQPAGDPAQEPRSDGEVVERDIFGRKIKPKGAGDGEPLPEPPKDDGRD